MNGATACKRSWLAAVTAACAVLAWCAAADVARAGGLDNMIGVQDAPSRYFPGPYFEQKAQFYLKKKHYREALRLFELSGYWADKVAQYNAGIMYFNGIGVPTDKIRGVAWLGIAAEGHDALADRALQAAYAGLTQDQRVAAGALFAQLDLEYGDAVALPRALARYRQDASQSLFGFGAVGPGTVETAGGALSYEENSATFAHRMDTQRAALIAQIRGQVTVGGVEPLPVPESDKRDASHVPLRQPGEQH
jgi:hypothetical protein